MLWGNTCIGVGNTFNVCTKYAEENADSGDVLVLKRSQECDFDKMVKAQKQQKKKDYLHYLGMTRPNITNDIIVL